LSILVLGTVALDTIKTPYGFKKKVLGGSAAHFSMSARLFTGVDLVAAVGEDFPPDYVDFLRSKKINISSLIIEKGRTFHWQGEYSGDLNTAFTKKTELGVLSSFKPRVTPAQRKSKYLFLANVDPDIQKSLLELIHSPRLVAVDSMNYWIEHKRRALLKLLKRVDIYVANDQEARVLSGEVNLIKAARALRRLGPKMVLIKKGEHGVLFYGGNMKACLPAYPASRVIDPTGAGDTFAGGFMGYLAGKGRFSLAAIKKALACGTIAASFNIEGFGLEKTAVLTLKDFKDRLREFKGYVIF